MIFFFFESGFKEDETGVSPFTDSHRNYCKHEALTFTSEMARLVVETMSKSKGTLRTSCTNNIWHRLYFFNSKMRETMPLIAAPLFNLNVFTICRRSSWCWDMLCQKKHMGKWTEWNDGRIKWQRWRKWKCRRGYDLNVGSRALQQTLTMQVFNLR